MPENLKQVELDNKKAMLDIDLALLQHNYNVGIKSAELILLTSRQAGLLALAAIASAAIWKDEVSLAWGKVWLALLLISAFCSVVIHLGITMMHMSYASVAADSDSKISNPAKDHELHDGGTRMSQIAMVVQIFALLIPLIAIIIAMFF